MNWAAPRAPADDTDAMLKYDSPFRIFASSVAPFGNPCLRASASARWPHRASGPLYWAGPPEGPPPPRATPFTIPFAPETIAEFTCLSSFDSGGRAFPYRAMLMICAFENPLLRNCFAFGV